MILCFNHVGTYIDPFLLEEAFEEIQAWRETRLCKLEVEPILLLVMELSALEFFK